MVSARTPGTESPTRMRPRASAGGPNRLQDRAPSPYGCRTGPPRLRATLAAAAFATVIGASLLAPGGASARARTHLGLTALEQSTVAQINSVRVAHGLDPLVISAALFDAASTQCDRMIVGGYFAHTAPDGQSFASRLEHFYPPAAHFTSYAIGENLFWTESGASSAEIVGRWMASPEHRANLLAPDWRQMGLATLTVAEAPGVYDGLGVTVVTVDFGVRS